MRQLAILLLASAAGCASVVNRPYEDITVASDPAGAVVSVECGDAPVYGGKTPTVVRVSRLAETCAITVAKEGFAEQHVDFERQQSKATRINQVPGVIMGSVFGLVALAISWDDGDFDFVAGAAEAGNAVGSAAGNAIDRKTGAAYKWVPSRVVVRLEPEQP